MPITRHFSLGTPPSSGSTPPPASSPVPAHLHATSQAPSPPTPPVAPSDVATPSEPPAFIADGFSEFREWCEAKRTRWPTSLVEFLSYHEFMFAKDLGDPDASRGGQTHCDYSWVPSILCDIFHSSLDPAPMLHILGYFLSLLSVLILSDATESEDETIIYRDLLCRTLAPSQGSLSLEPNFLGALDPADASDRTSRFHLEPEELSLVRELRRQLYQHLLYT